MRKNDIRYLGDGFSLIHFWVFNGAMITCYVALNILQTFAILGMNAFLLASENALQTTPLAQLGWAFLNLIYGLSLIIIFTLIVVMWSCGNLYIMRKELYWVMMRYFRWDEL